MSEIQSERRPPVAAFATDPGRSRGRRHTERRDTTRTAFQRDRDRILHAAAFRRLKNKTQVFLYDEGDHYRTRLTHTLEVSQIARSLARTLGLDEDLAEALALAHDLGHPPFGHAGERALDEEMAEFGGFDHNAQSLRVVTHLEARYAEFDGLNLTWETLEGLAKHNGPLTDTDGRPAGPYAGRDLPYAIRAANDEFGLELHQYAGAEAQAAALADDIAYDAHDIDDGLRAGLLDIDDLLEIPLTGDLLRSIRQSYPGLARERVTAELIRRMISVMITDVVAEARRRLAELAPASVADVRAAGAPVIAFGKGMAVEERAIKTFLRARLYRHERVMSVMSNAEEVARSIFRHYQGDPAAMPASHRGGTKDDPVRRARRTADFVAGMTDRLALAEYRRLFGSPPELGKGYAGG